jgi:Ring finger domain
MTEEKDKCPVCLGAFDNDHANICYTQCGHAFHTSCLIKSLKRVGTCPVCRNRLTPQEEKTDTVVSIPRRREETEITQIIREVDNRRHREFQNERAICHAFVACILIIILVVVGISLKVIVL